MTMHMRVKKHAVRLTELPAQIADRLIFITLKCLSCSSGEAVKNFWYLKCTLMTGHCPWALMKSHWLVQRPEMCACQKGLNYEWVGLYRLTYCRSKVPAGGSSNSLAEGAKESSSGEEEEEKKCSNRAPGRSGTWASQDEHGMSLNTKACSELSPTQVQTGITHWPWHWHHSLL